MQNSAVEVYRPLMIRRGCGATVIGMTRLNDWPKLPIWPEDLPLIRQLMTVDEFAVLLRRLVQVLADRPLTPLTGIGGEPSHTGDALRRQE